MLAELMPPFTEIPLRVTSGDGGEVVTDSSTVLLEGEAPVQLVSILAAVNDGDLRALEPQWTSQTSWRASFEVPLSENHIELFGFDVSGSLRETAAVIVRSTSAPVPPALHAMTPAVGPASGGTLVTLDGAGFVPGMTVTFGGVEAQELAVLDAERATVVTPSARLPLPDDRRVDVEIVVAGVGRVVAPDAFRYVLGGDFIRGDSNGDLRLNITDPVLTLFFLFRGESLRCADAADFDDSGVVNITDALNSLDALFRSGPPPAAPFPFPGADPTVDALECG